MIRHRALVPTLVATCIATMATTPTDDREAIREARKAHNAAIARHDYAAIARRWTDDINVRAGLGRAIAGKQAYRDAFVADSLMTYVREPDEITVSSQWPLAYERGKWRGTLRGSQPPATLSGEYSAQWIKRRGEWLIRSELFVATSCTGQACAWPAAVP